MSLQKKLKNFYTVGYLLTLKKSLDGDAKKIKANQNRKIRKLMKRAYKIPVYRKKFEETGTKPSDYRCSEDLAKFPTLTKAELRNWMQEEWDNNPEKQKDLNILSTSGSSGTPLKMLYTQKEQACSDANWARVLSSAGYNAFFGKMYSFATSHKGPRKNNRDSIIQSLGFMRRRVVGEDHAVGDGLAEVIDDINEYKPDLLCLRRNVLVRLVNYAEKNNLEIWKPKFYAPISEMIDEPTRQTLAKAFGPGLIDAYGVSEMGSFIYQFPGKDFYFVANDIAVANVLDDDDNLADEGRIVVTSLYKHTYPLINYETEDLGSSYVKDGLRYFTKIHGRMNDLVKHEKGADSSALQLMRIANHTVGLSQFRFVQKSYHDMLIQLVRDPFNLTLTNEEIEEHFITEVQKLYGDEFDIKIEWLEELPPEKTGKQRCFVCEVE
ncbi:MAG TPA: phenylacetate--CoA ligase family protein [Mogibacterium sp.]|nr:phenylacetate--CoA ligase family protein [Mogibacterium sp.]